MKLYLITFFFSLFIICQGCSKDEASNSPIKLSTYSVSVIAGTEYQVDVVQSEPNMLTVSTNKSKVASAWWMNDGNTILIQTHSIGNATIRVRDYANQDIFVDIEVNADYLDGDFEVTEKQVEVHTFSDAPDVKKAIESELHNMLIHPVGTIFHFNKESKTVQIKYPESENYREETGTYQWTMDDLIINTDNATITYPFATYDNNSVVLPFDLTNVYKSRYPDAQVHFVRLMLCLSRES